MHQTAIRRTLGIVRFNTGAPLPGDFLCYLAIFSIFGFLHGLVYIINGDLAAVSIKVVANNNPIIVDKYRVDEGIYYALHIIYIRPVALGNL